MPKKALSALAALALTCVSAFAGPQWQMYGGDMKHSAISAVTVPSIKPILWSCPVDEAVGGALIHYGSVLVTSNNTVILAVKTGASDGFKLQARRGTDGQVLWNQDTDFSVTSEGWIPSCGPALLPGGKVAVPGAGGTVIIRDNVDSIAGNATRLCFYGSAEYNAHLSDYNAKVKISTPITVDYDGNMYFGYQVNGSTNLNLASGIAKMAPDGTATYTTAAAAAADGSIQRCQTNCAPALSNDGTIVYVGVMDGGSGGYLVGLDAQSLTNIYKVRCKDPRNNNDIALLTVSTASPTVGPDGDVYFGGWAGNRYRGFMLHYDATLSVTKTPGAFGWDDTSSIIPASAVPSYHGTSTYLILTKYNDYLEGGGPGDNKMAVLDPNDDATDPISGAFTMKEVLTVLSPTHDSRGGAEAVTEWCINTAAIDPISKCAIVNNEDGHCYRWDFTTNTLSHDVPLINGVGEAYTPTAVGPDGTVYIINNHVMFAIGQNAIPKAVTFTQASVMGGDPTTGRVSLGGFVIPGGATMTLQSNNAAAVVPASVNVPAGVSLATFPVTTTAVNGTVTATITATMNGTSKSGTLLITKFPALDTLTLAPGTSSMIKGGTQVTFKVSLTKVSPAGGSSVLLTTSSQTYLPLPASMVIPAGQLSANVTSTTGVVNVNTNVFITASRAGSTRTYGITLTKLQPLIAVTIASNTATVKLSGPAEAGGANVLLSSSQPSYASVPALVTVPGGQSQIAVPITPGSTASPITVTITATRAAIVRSGTYVVNPPIVTLCQLSPPSVKGGQSSQLTVNLNYATLIDVKVALSSATPSAASVPATLTIPAGAASASTSVTTVSRATPITVRITASLHGGSASADLSIQP